MLDRGGANCHADKKKGLSFSPLQLLDFLISGHSVLLLTETILFH